MHCRFIFVRQRLQYCAQIQDLPPAGGPRATQALLFAAAHWIASTVTDLAGSVTVIRSPSI